MRYLCLSDIHGHADALSAVLATAERRGYSRILVAGDLCFPGPAPLATWQRLTQLNALCVQGVGDRAIATMDPEELRARDDFEQARLSRLRDVRGELGEAVLRKLAKLPPIIRRPLGNGRQLVLVHGCPRDPMEPITHDMDDDWVDELLGEDPADIVLCGGSHVPFDRMVPRRPRGPSVELPKATRVVNLGSVGEAAGAADEDGGPSGSYVGPRFAHATFVESGEGGIDVEQFVVPLGWAASSQGSLSA